MFSSVGTMSFRGGHTATSPAKNYAAHVPKGFSVRIFKGPTLSNFPYSGEPKFDVGYRPKPSPNSWQKPSWTTSQTKNEQASRDAPQRTSRLFGNTINPDSHIYRNDSQVPPNYSIYPSIAEDTYVYDNSPYSKSDTYTGTDITSDATPSPSSCFSTTFSNDSTATLHSTAITESLCDDPSTKLSSSTSFSAVPLRAKFSVLSRSLSSSAGTRETDARPISFFRSSTPAPKVSTSTSCDPDHNSSTTTTSDRQQFSFNHPFFTQSNNVNDSGAPFSHSTPRDNIEAGRPSDNFLNSRKSINRESFVFSGTPINVDQNDPHHTTRNDGDRQGARISSSIAEPGLSDGFSSAGPADISSAAATRGSSPPRQPPQNYYPGRSATPGPESRRRQDGCLSTESRGTKNHPTLRISTNQDEFLPPTRLGRDIDHTMTSTGPGQSIINNNNHDYRSDRLYIPARRDSGGDKIPRTTPGTRITYEEPSYLPQLENSSTFGHTQQFSQSSRTSDDRRKRSVLQPSFGESEAGPGERELHPNSQSDDPTRQAEFISPTSGTNARGFRNSFIEPGHPRRGENQYAPNPSFHVTTSNSSDRRERPVPRTHSPTEILPLGPTPVHGDPPLATNRDAYSTANTRAIPIIHSNTRRESPNNDRTSPSVAAISPSYNDAGYQTSSYQPRRNTGEQHGNLFSTQYSSSFVPDEYQQQQEDPNSTTRESLRRSHSLPVSQARDGTEHHAEIYQRRDSDEQRRRSSPTSYADEEPIDTEFGRRTNPRANPSSEHQRNRFSTIETRIFPEGLDDLGFRSATPGGTRCVRWNPNLIAPSPIFASQRRKGWFNCRGDQLWTNDGSYKPPPPDQEFPLDLAEYPNYGDGWMNEEGVRIDMRHRLIPKPPLRSALKRSSA